jgi:hypothetical protein
VKLQDAGILQKDEIESLCEIEASKPILAFINKIVTAPIAAAIVSAESEVVKEQKYDEIEKTATPTPTPDIRAKKPIKRKSNKNKKGNNKENLQKPAASQSKKMENLKSVDIPSCQASCSKALTPPPQEEITPKSEPKLVVSGDKGDLMKKIDYRLKKQKPLEQIYEMINVSNQSRQYDNRDFKIILFP